MLFLIRPFASRKLVNSLLLQRMGSTVTAADIEKEYWEQTLNYPFIGPREIVCKSSRSGITYADDILEPCPDVRYGVDTPEIREIQEKERSGHWMYRHSFRQTFAEIIAPQYEHGSIFGQVMMMVAAGVMIYGCVRMAAINDFSNAPPRDEEMQKKYLIRTIQQGQNKITGIASKWDYERGTWKWNP